MVVLWQLIDWAIAACAAIALFLSLWIVVPAPTFFLLPLGVGAPEVSPFLLLGQGIVLALALVLRGAKVKNRERSRSFVWLLILGFSATGLVLSSLPLLQLPATVRRAEPQMQKALGVNYSSQIPAQVQPLLRSRPFVLGDLIWGLPEPAMAPEGRSLTIEPQRQTVLTPDGATLALDIYQPPRSPTQPDLHPAIITIYGGAWQRGEPAATARFSIYMAAQGYTVVAIDYRHAPEYRFPTQLEDVQTALEWVGDRALNYDIDLSRIALVGWSAGAHLAMLAAYQAVGLPIRAVVNYYGPVNLSAGYYDPPVPDPIDTRAVLDAFLGGSPAQFPELYQQASPIFSVRPGLPPTLLIYGQRDHVVKPSYGQQLYEQLHASGNQVALIAIPWAEHAFDAVFRGPSNQIALYYTERFLAWALRPNP
ncbi:MULTISPECIES: alpha/beta hydrolase [Cyanophyceae]|uniref:alpha/beta hydrolase n=1 Tax=Cyanophyceae TaxID=3028117 RepID=UPI001683B277|nr:MULTISPECIES: alpha/beta hydrolase [Cyanophyceae]MBD1917525.1 alpha/beta hydrolase [Phormidium sp. FACHB-77]MBD2029600.1 alpha/beta hydrolase [Phormidium sp. FACHB-322]MBD2050861.1 alpha/beta hydrolase [Leptolyngbya sp. FACHB-60]